MKKFLILNLILILALSLSSCRRSVPFKYVEGKVNVVATTTMIGDLLSEIGKEHVSVTTVMNVGVDPHSFIPRPSVTRAISKADLVVTNGLNLEAKMGKVLHVLDDKLLELGSFVPEESLIKDENGEIDPHFWFDVNLWTIAAEALTNRLILMDEENELDYLNNFNKYKEKLILLDEYIKEEVLLIEEEKRVLITAHDAFSYFGKAYGFNVLSIQGISTESEASAKDIKDLANLIVDNNVKAIYLESSIPETTIKSLIDAVKVMGHNVIIGGTLYSDSLGEEGSGAENYLDMVRHNIDTIIGGLK
ncbi:MAG TPA: zinc ABC transporter solute-binding protein [Acholeplasma sp.]|jgi:manganese/zinc/iron transport system substrate-binding protein|nr:zinc ABC transporter solute-binding protein [Acholeplasma sp.]